jgi:hypothetical protein
LHKWRNQRQTRTSCGRFSHDTINPFRFRIYSLSLLQFPSLTATEIFMLGKRRKKIEKSLPSGSVDCVNRRRQSSTTFFPFRHHRYGDWEGLDIKGLKYFKLIN